MGGNLVKMHFLKGDDFVKELKAGYVELEKQLQQQVEESKRERKRKTALMKKILNIAQNEPIAMEGFLLSLGSHMNGDKINRIRELESAAGEMKERIATLEEY